MRNSSMLFSTSAETSVPICVPPSSTINAPNSETGASLTDVQLRVSVNVSLALTVSVKTNITSSLPSKF